MDAEQAYLFRHALLRDAAYELLVPADRSALHLLTLEVLEADLSESLPELPAPYDWEARTGSMQLLEASPLLATHSTMAMAYRKDVGLSRKAAIYAWIAGLVAMDRANYSEASEWFERCAEVDSLAPARRLEAALLSTGNLLRGDRISAAARQISSLLADKELRTDCRARGVACLLDSNVRHQMGDRPAALEAVSTSIELLENDSDSRLVSRALGTKAVLLTTYERWEDALSAHEASISLSSGQPESQLHLRNLHNYGNHLRLTGRLQEAVAIYRRTVASHRRAGRILDALNAESDLAEVTRLLGRLDESEQLAADILHEARALGSLRMLCSACATMSLCAAQRGNREEAEDWYRQARSHSSMIEGGSYGRYLDRVRLTLNEIIS